LRGISIRGDKRRLARSIANLLDNARNYAGGATQISVERSLDGDDTVLIAVEDAGPGVTSSDRHLIFERFNRGTVAGRRGMGDGTGLGLALVEGHVNLHRGQIWVEDRRDGKPGARFVIELPVATP
jgi:two-component system, OmpR family, sensor histidine kinase MtrB